MPNNTTIRHYGRVVNGKKIYYNNDLYRETLASIEGQEFEEVIKPRRKKVSNDAHGYYRGGIIGECLNSEIFAGWNRDEIHESHFAPMFLSYTTTIKYIAGKETMYREEKRVQSTATLSSKEMFEFCEKCIQWCAENDIIIHTPEEYLLGKFETQVRHI